MAKVNCKHIALTVLMGSPLFYCALRRKEYPKHCNSCPRFEAREPKEILMGQGMTEIEAEDFIEGCKKGLKTRREGKVIPWSQLKKELDIKT